MTARTKNRRGFWQNLLRREGRKAPEEVPAVAEPSEQVAAPELEIAPNDPILAYLASVSGVVEVQKLDFDSPALRAMKEAGVECATYARQGDPADAILDVAEEQGADLIVVGNKGMTGAKRFLLGSVPNKVSHHAPCSVLIIRTS